MKIKNLIFLWFLLLLIFLTAPYVMANTTVVGTGDPNIDVPAVRAAVAGGGTVLLSETFHFGDETTPYTGPSSYDEKYGYVVVTNSVEIVGENATIYGGINSIWVETPGIDVTIRGSHYNHRLTFINAQEVAIVVRDCGSITIENVDINGVITGWGSRFGIFASVRWTPPLLIPLRIGKLSIVGCNIDLGSYNDDTEHGRGIQIIGVGTTENEADILIEGNTVTNCSRHAIVSGDIAGTLTVKDNIVRPGNKAANYNGTGTNGIWTNQTKILSYDLPGGFDHYQHEWVRATIENNDVHCEPNTWANGARALGVIAFHQVGTVIKNNHIRVDDGLECIHIKWESDGFKVEGNTCTGSGLDNAIFVAGSAKNCIIKNNDSSAVNPINAQLFIESGGNNNSVINNDFGPGGYFGGIYCAGSNNHFVNNTFHGYYPGWPAIGFVSLDVDSFDNHVVALKKATPPHGFDICEQVWDDGTDNKISGYEKCTP